MKKANLTLTLSLTFLLTSNLAYAGLWENIKSDAAKSWQATKGNASGVMHDFKQSYQAGKNTSTKSLKQDAKKQGLAPVKPKEDKAGIPIE